MGRHSAPPPPAEAPVRARPTAVVPAVEPHEFTTVPWAQSPRSSAGAPTWTPAHRPMPAMATASADRHRPARSAPSTPPVSGTKRELPPEHRPVRAAGTPSTAPTPVQLPAWDAPSLSTAPIAVVPDHGRRSRKVRIGLGLATVVVTASVVAQIVALRSGAPEQPAVFDGSGVAATSPLPKQTVGGGAIITGRP